MSQTKSDNVKWFNVSPQLKYYVPSLCVLKAALKPAKGRLWKKCIKRLLLKEDIEREWDKTPRKASQCSLLTLLAAHPQFEISHLLTYSKWRQSGTVSIQETWADAKTCFCFQRRLCTFMRFLIEEELRSLRVVLIVPAAHFLLTERRGPWIQGSPLYFSLVCCGTVRKLMAFYCAQGQTRWVWRNLGALIRLKFSKCHAFWYLVLNKRCLSFGELQRSPRCV